MQDGRAGHALGHHQRAAVRAAPRVLPAQRILLALLQPGLLLLVQLAHALGVFPREVLVFRAAGFVGGHRSFLLTAYGVWHYSQRTSIARGPGRKAWSIGCGNSAVKRRTWRAPPSEK